MDLDKLYKILNATTIQLRKGEEVVERDHGALHVTEVFAMPHENEAKPGLEKVDLQFLTIGVDKQEAEKRKAELISILDEYPEPGRLKGGPSYIEVGGVIGDQGAAFQLFALGQVLGLWKVITPAVLGMMGEAAAQMAGLGMIMITGYQKGGEAK